MVIIDGDKDLIHKMVIRIDDTPLKFKHGTCKSVSGKVDSFWWKPSFLWFHHQILGSMLGVTINCTSRKINMEHNSLEAWKIIFPSKWVMAVGSSR